MDVFQTIASLGAGITVAVAGGLCGIWVLVHLAALVVSLAAEGFSRSQDRLYVLAKRRSRTRTRARARAARTPQQPG